VIYPPHTRDPNRIADIAYVVGACIIIVLVLAYLVLR
jgi:hypothetical protein